MFLFFHKKIRFTDKSIKDSILSNYENDPEMYSTHDPQKLFDDDDDRLFFHLNLYLYF